jgi:chromosome segregation ATPase
MKTLESRNEDINELRERLEDAMSDNSKLQEDKLALERMIRELNDIKSSQKVEITKLIEDNQKLSKICQDQDKSLKAMEMERSKLLSRNDEISFEMKNIQGRLKSREADLNYANKQIEDYKTTINKLQMDIRERDKEIELQRGDLMELNSKFNSEKQARLDAEKAGDDLSGMLEDREREISKLLNENDSQRANNQRLNDDKQYLGAENNRLKEHIMLLTEQNQKV